MIHTSHSIFYVIVPLPHRYQIYSQYSETKARINFFGSRENVEAAIAYSVERSEKKTPIINESKRQYKKIFKSL